MINVPVMNTRAVSGLTPYSTDLKTQCTVRWDRLYLHTCFCCVKTVNCYFPLGSSAIRNTIKPIFDLQHKFYI